MTEDSLRSNFRGDPNQFRIASRLNMINPKNPLVQRQMSIKSHDYLFPSKNRPRGQFQLLILDAFAAPQDADPLQFETISLPEEVALPVSHDLGGAAKPEIIGDRAVNYQSFFRLHSSER